MDNKLQLEITIDSKYKGKKVTYQFKCNIPVNKKDKRVNTCNGINDLFNLLSRNIEDSLSGIDIHIK